MRAPTDPPLKEVDMKPVSVDPRGRSLEWVLEERAEGR